MELDGLSGFVGSDISVKAASGHFSVFKEIALLQLRLASSLS